MTDVDYAFGESCKRNTDPSAEPKLAPMIKPVDYGIIMGFHLGYSLHVLLQPFILNEHTL